MGGFFAIFVVVYGVIALSHIAMQMLLGHLEHVGQRRREYGSETPSVTVVVPAFNEDPELLHRCLVLSTGRITKRSTSWLSTTDRETSLI